MLFLDRDSELHRLNHLRSGGLAVLYGRRRIGKTRLLLEWVRRKNGVYFVADQSSPTLQRRYLAKALGARLPAFDSADYSDWRGLFDRLAADAQAHRFRGPLVIDELPYLVAASPELPSVLQAFVDHGALTLALAGSSQRMMQGLVLDAGAPLFGRAKELIPLEPLGPDQLPGAFRGLKGHATLTAWTLWGGVPRYWELAAEQRGTMLDRVERLVLDPKGPLHHEPDRLLLEETPPAVELRPLLDAIGSGAHRLSEIAGRIGRPVTSLGRALDRLLGLGLVVRDVPHGESERATKRSLYRIADPFLRLWFRVVAPNRGFLAVASSGERRALLARHLPGLLGAAWEELCRAHVRSLGDWQGAGRWWQGSAAEWDLVSRSTDGTRLLVGECRAFMRRATQAELTHEVARLGSRPPPPFEGLPRVVRMLFVPEVGRGVSRQVDGVRIVTLDELW